MAAFEFFGGVPARLVPDNLKTGVDTPDLHDPKINKACAELKMARVDGCVLCGLGHGREHVLPRWLLDRWDDDGPFSVNHAGRPLLDSKGSARSSPKMWRLMPDLCRSCNGLLNSHFEVAGKPALRALLDSPAGVLDRVATVA